MTKGKILIMLIVVLIAGGGIFAVAYFTGNVGGNDAPASIYDIANNSTATAVTTKIAYASPDGGDDFGGWYVAKRDGNNMIVEYEYDRYRTVEESVATGVLDRIVKEEGTVYYLDGKYYNSIDETKTPWVDLPLDANFSFKLDKNKLTGILLSADGNTLTASMTGEACLEMFGLDISCEGPISISVQTNGVQLTEIEMTYTTDSGADVTIRTTYSYNDLTLDFTPVTGEEETDEE